MPQPPTTHVLLDSPQAFEALMEASPTATIVIDLRGRVLLWNKAAEEIYGWTAEEVLGRSLAVVSPEHKDQFDGFRAKIAKGEVIRGIEITRHRKDGTPLLVTLSAAPARDAQGRIYAMIGLHADITAQRAAEAKLLHEQEFNTAVVETVGAMVTVVDEEGRIVKFNRTCETLTGYTRQEALGRFYYELLQPPEDWQRFFDLREQLHRGLPHNPGPFERDILTKSGDRLRIVCTDTLVRNTDGSIRYYLRTGIDVTDRHRVEASQQAMEANLQEETEFKLAVVNTVGALVCVLDPFGKVVLFNRACEASTGYSCEEVTGKVFYELLQPREDWEETIQSLAGMRQGLPGRRQSPYEREWIAKDGKRRRILWTNTSLRNPDKSLRYYIGTGIDITDKRRAEAALRAIEAGTSRATGRAFFKNLVEQLACALGVRCAMVSSLSSDPTRAQSLATWDRGPAPDIEYGLVGTPSALTIEQGNYFHPADTSLAFPQDPLLASKGLESFMGTRLRDSVGHPIGLLSLMHDGPMPDVELAQSLLLLFSGRAEAEIERTGAEVEARRLRGLLQDTIDSMPSILASVDGNLVVSLWNRGAEELTGSPAADVVGQSLFDVFPPLLSFKGPIKTALARRDVYRQPRMTWDRRGESRLADLTVYPLTHGEELSAVVRIDDVTDRIRMEETIIQSDKMMSVGGLAAGMAHEINNPLAGMMQSAQVIENRLNPDLESNKRAAAACGMTMEQVRDYALERGLLQMLSAIRESGGRAARIVDNMLRFSRKSDSQPKPCDLNSLIEQTLEIVRSDYDFKKRFDFQAVKVVLNLDPTLPQVPCQEIEIQQVILNIVRNAAAAMASHPTGPGPARLEVRSIVESERGNWARIDILDNGPGMRDDVRRRVFEPFFSTKGPGEGTGLGLSVSYFIITENHGGTLTVESEPGSGTCFTIRLPLVRKDGPP